MPPTRRELLLVADLIELTDEFERWPRLPRDPAVMDCPGKSVSNIFLFDCLCHTCSEAEYANSSFVFEDGEHGRSGGGYIPFSGNVGVSGKGFDPVPVLGRGVPDLDDGGLRRPRLWRFSANSSPWLLDFLLDLLVMDEAP